MPADPTAGTPRTVRDRLFDKYAGATGPWKNVRADVLDLIRENDALASGTGLDANLWSDVVKFIRWSANVRDDTAENVAIARELLSRLSPVPVPPETPEATE